MEALVFIAMALVVGLCLTVTNKLLKLGETLTKVERLQDGLDTKVGELHPRVEELLETLTALRGESASGYAEIVAGMVYMTKTIIERDESNASLIKRVGVANNYGEVVMNANRAELISLSEAIVSTYKRRGQLPGDEDTRASALAEEIRSILVALDKRKE